MSIDVKRNYIKKIFQPGEFANAIRIAICNEYNEDDLDCRLNHSIANLGNESKQIKISDIIAICDLGSINSLYIRCNKDFFEIFISPLSDSLYFSYCSDNIDVLTRIMNNIEKELNLELIELKYDLSIKQEIQDIRQSIHFIQNQLDINKPKLRCFISYRFTDNSKYKVLELTRFLELIGIEVITGVGYEPRTVSEKVLSKLSNPLDFIIYLLTKDGESTWIRDEMAVAVGKGYSIIPLVEEGVTLEKGILGDLEYIPFDHISDSYIGILEAINFIKEKRSSTD